MTKEEAQRILDALDQIAIKCGVIRSQEEVDLIERNAKLIASRKAAKERRFADMVADAVVRKLTANPMEP